MSNTEESSVIRLSDEQIAANHLMELRSTAYIMREESAGYGNPDAKTIMESAASNMLVTARALHRLFQKAGVKGLGAINY